MTTEIDGVASLDLGSVERAVQALRALIAGRKLLPGEQLKQEDLSRLTQTSRGTLREALQVLAVERLVSYTRNRGYTVAKFEADEMRQLYELRDFAEQRLLESIPTTVGDDDIAVLVEINDQIKASLDQPHAILTLNDEFHLKMFELSPLQIIAEETRRWWHMSTAYRALSVTTSPDRSRIASDHDRMIDALRRGDTAGLVAIGYEHRHDSLYRIIPAIS
ncbi:GntR family transcriptional regulator [Acrocarpospora macrocephala]|uniref:GntR family transcriptional regulator n=1 Tax=Acrocarpospora macrocephala TaxID=150177 RepID=A0A5M3WZ41_9ACTN|nr:GntR family transcriptional regulator [Acrocarpospora macrocephala]GES14755.1 GntR family transcriptional regulator [Acrocarpospora macrocephala]